MKIRFQIAVSMALMAAFATLAWFNHAPTPFAWWIGKSVEMPLVGLLGAAWLVGVVFAILFFVAGGAGEAIERRLYFWEAGTRRRARGLLNRGKKAMSEGRLGDARELFEKSIKEDLRFSGGHEALARLLLEDGLDNEAYEEARKAASLDPTDPDALMTVATCAMKCSDPVRAADALTKLVEINPRSDRARRMLPTALAGAGRWEEAIAVQARILKRASDETKADEESRLAGYMTAHGKAVLAGNRKKGLKILKKAVKKSPSFVPAARTLAEVMIEDGNSKDAAKCLGEALKLTGEPALYEMMIRLGDEARATAEVIASEYMVTAPRKRGLRIARSRMLLKDGRFTDAAEEIGKISGERDMLVATILMLASRTEKLSDIEVRILESITIPHECEKCGEKSDSCVDECPKCGSWNTVRAL